MRPAVVVSLLVLILLSGCGLNVTSADLFVLTRTGQGQKLTMLVSDGGTIRCNGGRTRALPNALLLQARDIAAQPRHRRQGPSHVPAEAGQRVHLSGPAPGRNAHVRRHLSNGEAPGAGRGPSCSPYRPLRVAAGSRPEGQPSRTLPFDRARAWARSTKSSRFIAARKSRVTRRSRAFSDRRSSRPCFASSPKSTVAAIP